MFNNWQMTEQQVQLALVNLWTKISPECIAYYTDEYGVIDLDPSAGYEMTDDGILVEFADGVTTVEKMLDYADVELDWYIPSKAAIDFMIFIRLCLGEEPENSNPKAHYFFIDCVFQECSVEPYFKIRNIDYDELKDRVAILSTREFGKSVLMAYLFLYMAERGSLPNFGKVEYGIYIGDSMENNVKSTMKTIRKVYNESLYLSDKFESALTNFDFCEFVRKPKTASEIKAVEEHLARGGKLSEAPGRMKRTFSLKGIGASTGGKGSREGLARPHFNVFDDLVQSKSDANSKPILSKIENTIESDILPGLNNNKNFAVLIGTPYNKTDPVYRRIEERSWLPVVFPRGIYQLEGKAYPMARDTTKDMFKPVWEDRHSYVNCKKAFKKTVLSKENGNSGPMRDILQEHYLRISSDEDRMIPDSLIQQYKRTEVMKNLSSYNIYITTDFTTTSNSQSDLSGILVWAVNSNMDWFLLDISLKQLELEEQYNTVFQFAQQYGDLAGRSVTVGVETDGQQRSHIQALKDRMIQRSHFFIIGRGRGASTSSEGILSRLEGGNKHWRFRLVLPMFQNRKFYFPEEIAYTKDMKELMDELKYVTYDGFNSKDDGLDCISQTGMMDVIYPTMSRAGTEKRRTVVKSAETDFWERHSPSAEPDAYESYQ